MLRNGTATSTKHTHIHTTFVNRVAHITLYAMWQMREWERTDTQSSLHSMHSINSSDPQSVSQQNNQPSHILINHRLSLSLEQAHSIQCNTHNDPTNHHYMLSHTHTLSHIWTREILLWHEHINVRIFGRERALFPNLSVDVSFSLFTHQINKTWNTLCAPIERKGHREQWWTIGANEKDNRNLRDFWLPTKKEWMKQPSKQAHISGKWCIEVRVANTYCQKLLVYSLFNK